MSSRQGRARRLGAEVSIDAFKWNSTALDPQPRAIPRPAAAPIAPLFDRDASEREAFQQGYAQGERAGGEAAAARSDAVLRRLAQTIDEVSALRQALIHKTERQVVHLALAIAKRVIHREVSLDRELLTAMARVALDRLGTGATATIRLHPDDYAAMAGARGLQTSGVVQVVADPSVRRGGCHIQSDFGLVDLDVDSQIQELAKTLFGADDSVDPIDPAEALVAR
jgi:flagellar assembly protein FliH